MPGYDQSVPMTDLAKFPQAVPAVWSGGSLTIATSGATFLSGSQWGGWDWALAVACLKGSQLRIAFWDASDRLTGQTSTSTGYGRLRSPVQGPDGNLDVTTSNGKGSDVIVKVTLVVIRRRIARRARRHPRRSAGPDRERGRGYSGFAATAGAKPTVGLGG